MRENKIYNIFICEGEGDGYRRDILIGNATTLEDAFIIRKPLMDRVDPAFLCHPTMDVANGYTYVGRRTDLTYYLAYGVCGGFCIEQNALNEAT